MSLMSLPPPLAASYTNTVPKLKIHIPNLVVGQRVLPNLLSLALAVTLTTPLPSHAIPSLNSQSPPISLTTPFSQSKNLELGLENGKIRPCPSINPGCISTNPKSSSFSFPWLIPANSLDDAIQKLREAILKTQKNVKFQLAEDTPDGVWQRK
ncbi:thylakoid lumenal 17.9 kDa protein, chloroplastic isoform X2 [Cajanus cajan]|uniref:thylakoid lumenal 17.9 kDa protein, chloroplastic isoform X2 n=1 Tax=Cajanus cajan TaxID=3821 RepID=UPI00098D8EC8|nr:thylakoid lumenal 17.9 kDa protein, chloroplastic isoform X2 [Cajanus cajan]